MVTAGQISSTASWTSARISQIVDADAAFVVELRRCAVVEALGEEALDLLDAAFVQAFLLHDPVEQRNVERHHGDGGTGLGDQRLVDRDVARGRPAGSSLRAMRPAAASRSSFARPMVPLR